MKSEYLAEVKVITIPNYAIGLMIVCFPIHEMRENVMI